MVKKGKRPSWAAWILHRCLDKGMRQKDLADKSGWSTAYVSDLLAGRRDPTVDVVNSIAVALKLNKDDKTELHRLAIDHLGWKV